MRITNKARANRALAALMANESIWFKTDNPIRGTVYDSLMAYLPTRISELVSQLHHLANQFGLSWEDLLKTASEFYDRDIRTDNE